MTLTQNNSNQFPRSKTVRSFVRLQTNNTYSCQKITPSDSPLGPSAASFGFGDPLVVDDSQQHSHTKTEAISLEETVWGKIRCSKLDQLKNSHPPTSSFCPLNSSSLLCCARERVWQLRARNVASIAMCLLTRKFKHARGPPMREPGLIERTIAPG